MIERLTREQMAQKYPDMWLGLSNIKYANDDGVTLESADVVYTDKTEDELFAMQLDGTEEIISWYTNDNALPLGVAGGIIMQITPQLDEKARRLIANLNSRRKVYEL